MTNEQLVTHLLSVESYTASDLGSDVFTRKGNDTSDPANTKVILVGGDTLLEIIRALRA
jgi:hypothetical protein